MMNKHYNDCFFAQRASRNNKNNNNSNDNNNKNDNDNSNNNNNNHNQCLPCGGEVTVANLKASNMAANKKTKTTLLFNGCVGISLLLFSMLLVCCIRVFLAAKN
jgi:hypothetical protein